MATSVFAIGDIRRKSFGSENGWSDQRMTGRDARIDEPNDRRSRARWVYRRQVVEFQGEELRWCQRWAGQDIKPAVFGSWQRSTSSLGLMSCPAQR